MATGDLSPEVKWLRYEADHSPPSGAEVKNGWTIPPLTHTSSWRGAYLIKHRDNFTFTLWTMKYSTTVQYVVWVLLSDYKTLGLIRCVTILGFDYSASVCLL
jgi:hypothetical protein